MATDAHTIGLLALLRMPFVASLAFYFYHLSMHPHTPRLRYALCLLSILSSNTVLAHLQSLMRIADRGSNSALYSRRSPLMTNSEERFARGEWNGLTLHPVDLV